MPSPHLINVHRPGGPSRVWLTWFAPTELYELDDIDEVGTMDDMIRNYIDDCSWDYILGIPWHNEIEWFLENHLAPSQAFCVEVSMPEFWQDYWGEWDSSIEVSIVTREPMSDRMAAHRWSLYLGRLKLKKGIWR